MKPVSFRPYRLVIAALLAISASVALVAAAENAATPGQASATVAQAGKVAMPSSPQPSGQAGTAPSAKPSGPVPAEEIKGVDFSGLTDDQKKLVVALLNEYKCPCPCGMKLAQCRRDMGTCKESLDISNQVIDLVKKGKNREEIVKAALTPATMYVKFDIPVGEAPSVGPKDAKVTILHYLDYQ